MTNYCYWTLDKDCFYDEAETIYDMDSITPDMWVYDITETAGNDRIQIGESPLVDDYDPFPAPYLGMIFDGL